MPAPPISQKPNCFATSTRLWNFTTKLPPNAVNDLAGTHDHLGSIYCDAGNLDRALQLFREAMRYWEGAGDFYNAANARYNVALALQQAGRLSDAAEYTHAALFNYKT